MGLNCLLVPDGEKTAQMVNDLIKGISRESAAVTIAVRTAAEYPVLPTVWRRYSGIRFPGGLGGTPVSRTMLLLGSWREVLIGSPSTGAAQ